MRFLGARSQQRGSPRGCTPDDPSRCQGSPGGSSPSHSSERAESVDPPHGYRRTLTGLSACAGILFCLALAGWGEQLLAWIVEVLR